VSDVGGLFERAARGDRRALGRVLTVAERDGDAGAELATLLLERDASPAHIVGVTGAPGAGKSTLTGGLLDALAAAGRRTAVLAVDPSSPFTGGAILGDRIRMDRPTRPSDDATFIRSLASRGQHGGLSIAVPAMVRALEAVGYDPVIVETVGVGQIELDIAALADTTIVVVTPGWGDAIQANKAGVLEIADVFAVNKSDRPGALDAVRDLERMLDMSTNADGWRPPVHCTIGTDGSGVADLLGAIDAHGAHLDATGARGERRRLRERAEVRARAERALLARIDATLDDAEELLAGVEQRQVTAIEAAHQVVAQVRTTNDPR
jgi:LAO/AO transport system kinase